MSQSHDTADINECLIRNFDGCPQDRSQCSNTVGSFVCVCNPGYVSDGENNCIGIKKFVAIIYIIDYRAAYVYISNSVLYYWFFTAFFVTDEDECATNTDDCDINADCTNTVGSFTCECRDSYFGDGISCDRELLS